MEKAPKKLNQITWLFFLFALCLGGCHHTYTPVLPLPSDPAASKMAEASVAVSDSLFTLQAIRKAQTPGYQKRLVDPNTYCMTQLASVDWTGPIEPLVRKIGEASRFRVRVLGRPPAIPIIVQIYARNTPLAEILRDADFQAGKKADVRVYPSSKVIELRYNKPILYFHKEID